MWSLSPSTVSPTINRCLNIQEDYNKKGAVSKGVILQTKNKLLISITSGTWVPISKRYGGF